MEENEFKQLLHGYQVANFEKLLEMIAFVYWETKTLEERMDYLEPNTL